MENQAQKKKSRWLLIALILFFTFIIPVIPAFFFFIIYIFIARPFQVNGDAMAPTYTNGQYVLAGLVDKTISRNDVVILESPFDGSKDLIKRVVGIPGDTIVLTDGTLLVNGKPVDSKSAIGGGAFLNEETVTVPEDSYFVLGDYHEESTDSREFGFIRNNLIIGKVLFCYYNCQNANRQGAKATLGYMITLPKQYVREENATEVVYRTPTMNPEKVVTVHSETSQLHDPCEQIPPLYPNASCTTINGYKVLDLGSHIPPFLADNPAYSYILVNNGKLYRLTFSNLTEEEKDEVLNTFAFN